MQLNVITIFPELVEALTSCGVVGRAFANHQAQLNCINPRDFSTNKHRNVDDRPFGGGPGMVMQVEPLVASLEAAQAPLTKPAKVIYLSPQGQPLTQKKVADLAAEPALTLVAGRYEGVDQRFIDHWVDEEISVGDYVVSGGELPAMLLIDAILRLLPGVLGDAESAALDSFSHQDEQTKATLLDYPHYSRPADFRGHKVPEVLLSGDHQQIAKWRQEQAMTATKAKRPDLLECK